jgi:hypothetical protein
MTETRKENIMIRNQLAFDKAGVDGEMLRFARTSVADPDPVFFPLDPG